MEVRVEGLNELIDALDNAAKVTPEQIRKVVARGALQIKKDWQQRWSGHSYIPALPYAVSYDTKLSVGGGSAEIGPDKGRPQGPLGNLIEFGSENNAPIPGGQPALDAEAPRFEKALGDLAEKVLG